MLRRKNVKTSYENFVDIANVYSLSNTNNNQLSEDKCLNLELESSYFSAILDGIGQGKAGDLITQISVDAITRELQFYENSDPKTAIIQAIKEANRLILLRKSKFANEKMQISLTGVMIKDREVCIANLGNCRAYLIRHDAIRKLTVDHTYIQELLNNGIKPTEKELEENKHVLTRTLGGIPNVDISTLPLWIWDCKDCDVNYNDLILICTDGFYENISEEDITLSLIEANGDYKTACKNLLKLAEQKNSEGNISLIFIPLKGQLKNVAPPRYKQEDGVNKENGFENDIAEIVEDEKDIDNITLCSHVLILTILFNFITVIGFILKLI